MTIGLRRLLATAFIAALAGIGVVTALRGRRPRTRLTAPAEELVPLADLFPPSEKLTKRGPRCAVVGLLLFGGLVGVFTASHGPLFKSGSSVPGDDARTLAVLSPPDSARSRRLARETEITTGSLRATDPDGYTARPTPPPPASAVPDVEDRTAETAPIGTGSHSAQTAPSSPPRNSESEPSEAVDQGADRHALATIPDEVPPLRDSVPITGPTLPNGPVIHRPRPNDKPATSLPGGAVEPESDPSRDTGETTARQGSPNVGTSATEPGSNLHGIDIDGANAGKRVGDGGDASRAGLATDITTRTRTGATVVFVPEIETTRIVRGDSLWRISRRTYSKGARYTSIVGANKNLIRDPDLIYPGQVLVLPSRSAPMVEGRRD